jgi:hypothetical protein
MYLARVGIVEVDNLTVHYSGSRRKNAPKVDEKTHRKSTKKLIECRRKNAPKVDEKTHRNSKKKIIESRRKNASGLVAEDMMEDGTVSRISNAYSLR